MAPPAPRVLPDDDFATFVRDEFTVILSTENYRIDQDFPFTTQYCLLYDEMITISTKLLKQPGKTIGIFCFKLIIREDIDQVIIDVSRRNGDAGSNSATDDGEDGNAGRNGGDVWIFGQDRYEEMFKKLQIKTFGGDGGKGGDASAQKDEKGKA